MISVAENRSGAFMSGRVTITLDNTIWDGSSTPNPTTGTLAVATCCADLSGNVGIGITNPAQKLHVNGNARVDGNLSLYSSGESATIKAATYNSGKWIDVSGFKADYGIYNHGEFHCEGYATFDEGYGSSDIRKKNIITHLERTVEDIAKAPIFDFTWKQKPNKGTHLGTSAQYWQGVLPTSITTAPDGYLAMDYGATALAAAVFTARKVSDHELRVRQLEERVRELENELETIKAA